jgi:hypothetical protein
MKALEELLEIQNQFNKDKQEPNITPFIVDYLNNLKDLLSLDVKYRTLDYNKMALNKVKHNYNVKYNYTK